MRYHSFLLLFAQLIDAVQECDANTAHSYPPAWLKKNPHEIDDKPLTI
jgi:hypothetical protein